MSSQLKTWARRILGAVGLVALWFVDAYHLVIDRALPIAIYAVPVGIGLGWKVEAFVKVIAKGTKFESVVNPKEKVTVSKDLLLVSVKAKVPKSEVEEALRQGLSDTDIIDLIKEDSASFRLMFDQD